MGVWNADPVQGDRVAQLNDYERRLIADVESHGWFCLSVLADGTEPGFSYSVGLAQTLRSPECIIFGLPSELMHSMLGRIFDQLKAGAVLEDGRRWSGLIEGFDCISRPVHPSRVVRKHFSSAPWYWNYPTKRDRPLAAYQIFWPGAVSGQFPWESGCDPQVRDLQPLLYLPDAVGLA